MKSLAMKTWILADDLQVISTGPRHLENVKDVFDKTHAHLHAMGAKIVANKSITFTSNESPRKWLRRHRWRRLGKTVPVVTDTRDLGAHLNTSENRAKGTTLSDRMRKTAGDTKRLDYVNAP